MFAYFGAVSALAYAFACPCVAAIVDAAGESLCASEGEFNLTPDPAWLGTVFAFKDVPGDHHKADFLDTHLLPLVSTTVLVESHHKLVSLRPV